MTVFLIKERKKIHEKSHVKKEGVSLCCTNQEKEEASKKYPLEPSERVLPYKDLIFRLLASKTVK